MDSPCLVYVRVLERRLLTGRPFPLCASEVLVSEGGCHRPSPLNMEWPTLGRHQVRQGCTYHSSHGGKGSASPAAVQEQGPVHPSEAECLKVAAERSLLVLRVLGIGKKNRFLL